MVTPAGWREAAGHLQAAYEMSERRACRVLGVDRTSVRYQATRPDDGALRDRLRALAQERRRFGYEPLNCFAAVLRSIGNYGKVSQCRHTTQIGVNIAA